MRAYFERVFAPVLQEIRDESLRRKTVEAWELAAKQGGWNSPESIEAIPFTLLTETGGVNLIEHTLAVTTGAVGLAEGMRTHYRAMPFVLDDDLLRAGGLLHDVGKLDEIEKTDTGYRKSHSGRCARHPISGAIIAARVGLPPEIVNIIACHAKEGDGRPQRAECVLIHQADFATFNPMVMKTGGLLIE